MAVTEPAKLEELLTGVDNSGTPTVILCPAPRAERSFANNVLKLVSGSTLAQVVTLLTAPFIARLFAPEAFGAAALFAALTGLVSAVVGMRYELSVVLPERDEEAANTAVLSVCFVVLISSLSGLLIGLFGDRLLAVLRATELHGMLWLAPINIFFGGVYATLTYWNIRKKRFGIQSVAQLAGSIFFVAAQIIAGLKGYRSASTIIQATVGSAFITIFILGVQAWWDSGKLFLRVRGQGMLYALKRYSNFPKYSTASAMLNNLGWQTPALLLSAFFSTGVVGFYSLGNKLLRLPVSLIGANIATVFFQHASEARRQGSLSESVEKMFHYLIKLFLFPSLLLTLVGEDVFVVIFGRTWAEAGVYTQILSIYVLFWFLAVPLGITLNVLEKQALELRIISMVLLARVVALMIGGAIGDARTALTLFSAAGVVMYGYYCFVVFRNCNIPPARIGRMLGREFGLFVPAGLILGVFKWLHAAPGIIMAVSIIALALYYVHWIHSDPIAREAIGQWQRKLNRRSPGPKGLSSAA